MIETEIRRISMIRSYLEAEIMERGFEVDIDEIDFSFEPDEKHPFCKVVFSCDEIACMDLAVFNSSSDGIIDEISRGLIGLSKYSDYGNAAELATFQFTSDTDFTLEFGIDGRFDLDLTDFDPTNVKEVTIEFVVGTIMTDYEDDRDDTKKIVVPIIEENLFRDNLNSVLSNLGLKNGTQVSIYYSAPIYENGRLVHTCISRGTYTDGILKEL